MDFLNGIKVVEFSHMVMGPVVGMVLADLGAEVIKIEPIGGDKTRSLPGSGAGYFAMFNRNKKSICVDLKSKKGRAVVMKLLAGADVMIENFRPGALDKLGLDYESVKTTNPAIIYQSSKGFLSGPYQQRTALDEVAQMMGGLAYMTGPSGQPLRAGSSVIDITGGLFGVIGILAALQGRQNRSTTQETTDTGAQVTSALYETTAFLVGQHMAQHAVTGQPAPPMPERISAWAVYDVFSALDGQIFVGVVSDGQWVKFCSEFDLTDWARDALYARNADRVRQRDTIIPKLRALFSDLSLEQLTSKLDQAGLPYAPIRKPEDLTDDIHLAAHGLQSMTLPDTGQVVQLPNLPVEIDGHRAQLRHDLPASGGDVGTVLAELGYDLQAIADLRAEGVIG